MIEAYYSRTGDDYFLGVYGHAQYDAHGRDIVCAGVSAITFALLGFLNSHGDDIRSLDTRNKSGEAEITCTGNETIGTAFEMAAIGIAQIAAKYPDNVTYYYTPLQAADSREKTARKEHDHHAQH